jgi:hydrogenase maturation protein HypF
LTTVRAGIRVEGIVQGVGFRPFIHSLATRFGLSGFVGNDTAGVFVEVEGDPGAVDGFLRVLTGEGPPLALIERVTSVDLPTRGGSGFRIAESPAGGQRRTLISPDSATCEDCLHELFDPSDRRFGYAFINCTNCGPRFTIVRDVPYDRPSTTMAGFPMCQDCSREYHDPSDRRFHAQPVCCPACGPHLSLTESAGARVPGDPVEGAARLLAEGRVVAVKGLGGYHLAVDATSEEGASALRARKHREDKPFAVMVRDLTAARTLCDLTSEEERLLQSLRRPVVLARRRAGAPVASAVAPGNGNLGLMLPYTPLHHLLAGRLGRPFVLTSGNVSDEPIAYLDEDATDRLASIADAFLAHDRPIHMRTDDSVVRVFRERELPVRRSRGYVPQPLALPRPFPRAVLACGAELKNTFAVAKDGHVFVSHHIGDLENFETYRSFMEGVEHFRRLFDIDPEIVAHDLHPEYLSTKYALDLQGVEHLGVQHHHAHVASCLADNGEEGPAIGVAFDGLGFGTDGTIWGGEFLVADLAGFDRAAHLEAVPMPGGAAAIKEPWRMALAYLEAAGIGGDTDLDVRRRNQGRWGGVLDVALGGVNSPVTSSAGRLFDAVAALIGVRDRINYEGQAAVELEQLADPAEPDGYTARLTDEAPFRVLGSDLVAATAEDLRGGVDPATIAARFHNGVAAAIVAACERIRSASGLSTVALSGGVFQNMLLLGRTVTDLEERGFRVLIHSRVPPNDGGISLGQAAVAGAHDRLRAGTWEAGP